MPRPKAELPPASAIRELIDAEGRLAIRVSPGARREAIELAEGKLLVRVHAQPEDGKANLAVVVLLAKALDVAPSRIKLVRGATSREKLLRIES